jgi:hypothetical protein
VQLARPICADRASEGGRVGERCGRRDAAGLTRASARRRRPYSHRSTAPTNRCLTVAGRGQAERAVAKLVVGLADSSDAALPPLTKARATTWFPTRAKRARSRAGWGNVRPRGCGRPNGLEVHLRGQGPRGYGNAARRLLACNSRGAGGVPP